LLEARVEREKPGEGASEDGQQKGGRGLTKYESLATGIAPYRPELPRINGAIVSYMARFNVIAAISCSCLASVIMLHFALRHMA
jgi:hypothetical protein